MDLRSAFIPPWARIAKLAPRDSVSESGWVEKTEWREELHPRERGRFAPKGSGEAPSPKVEDGPESKPGSTEKPGELPKIVPVSSKKTNTGKVLNRVPHFGMNKAFELKDLMDRHPQLDTSITLSLKDSDIPNKAKEMLSEAVKELRASSEKEYIGPRDKKVLGEAIRNLQSKETLGEVTERMSEIVAHHRSVKARADAWVGQSKLPEGFTLVPGKRLMGTYEESENPMAFTISGPDVQVSLTVGAGTYDSEKKLEFSGTTRFKEEGGRWNSFDATGVSDSFYGDDGKSLTDVVNEEVTRGRERAAQLASFQEIPGIGYRSSPGRIEEIRGRLKEGKEHSFEPRGFGTAKIVSTKPHDRYSRRAPKELEDFFGAGSLYITEQERD